jgi:hypothetical protein
LRAGVAVLVRVRWRLRLGWWPEQGLLLLLIGIWVSLLRLQLLLVRGLLGVLLVNHALLRSGDRRERLLNLLFNRQLVLNLLRMLLLLLLRIRNLILLRQLGVAELVLLLVIDLRMGLVL